MTIHAGHPFAVPGPARDGARRFRGGLPAPVTLWLTGSDAARAGLTVSSVLVALGEEPVVVGLVDPDSDFALRLEDRCTVSVLTPADRVVADAFAGVAPAPGGVFRTADFLQTPWGPRLSAPHSWVGAVVLERRPLGWSEQVVARIEHVEMDAAEPVVHHRGRYRTFG